MKAIMFAGGVGTRLWPISRKRTPKQFEKIVSDKSMIQIAIQKLFPEFKWQDIFVSTGQQYEHIVRQQLPQLPQANLILEPEMRDVGPAVGLVTALFTKTFPDEPILLLWGSDHLVKKEALFRQTIKVAEKIILDDRNRVIFIGQKPRFPSQNLGYIEYGKEVNRIDGLPVYEFMNFQYRPHLSIAEKFYKDGHHTWNLGYFVTTPRFLWKLFSQFSPELFTKLKKIQDAYGTHAFKSVLKDIFPTIEKISFDNAVLEKMDPKFGRVISVDIGWSDIGAWEALKEALETTKDKNVTHGKVLLTDTDDSLVYNYTKQLLVTIDVKEFLVVNTDDVTLVCHKDSVPKIKKLVESLGGTKHEDLT